MSLLDKKSAEVSDELIGDHERRLPTDENGQTLGLATRTKSGLRPKSVITENDEADSPLDLWDEEIPSFVQPQEVDREGVVTMPDIGAVLEWSQREVEKVDSFIEQLDQSRAIDETILMPEETLEDDKYQMILGKMADSDRILLHLQRHADYKVAWWTSPNSLVRLWGQLNASGQVLTDEAILADIVAVLGPDFEVVNDVGTTLKVELDIRFIRLHHVAIKELIRQKYPDLNLDAIIARKSK